LKWTHGGVVPLHIRREDWPCRIPHSGAFVSGALTHWGSDAKKLDRR
jgi:hypothetical protein